MLRFVMMFTKKLHGLTAILMMAFLLSAKFMVYHSVSHSEGLTETCSICEHAILTSHTPVMESEPGFDIPMPPPPNYGHNPAVFHEIYCQTGDPENSLFCRPPPRV